MAKKHYPWAEDQLSAVASDKAEDPCFGDPIKEIKIMLGEHRIAHIYGWHTVKLDQKDLERLSSEILSLVELVRTQVRNETLQSVRDTLGIRD